MWAHEPWRMRMIDLPAINVGLTASILLTTSAWGQLPDCDESGSPDYAVVSLTGLMPGTFSVSAINDDGVVAGLIFADGGEPYQAFVWSDGELITRALNGQGAGVSGLTADGRVVGMIDRGGGAGASLFVWSSRTDDLQMIDTPVPVFATDVNNDLIIVGADFDGLYGFALDVATGGFETIAFGKIPKQHVGTHGAAAINGGGLVVGSEVVFLPDRGYYQEIPYTWTANGGIVELPGVPGGFGGRAAAVNNAGDIAGIVLDEFFAPRYALWPDGVGEPITFAALPSLTPMVVTAINDAGQVAVVGDNDWFGYTRGLVWQEGEFIDLTCSTLDAVGLYVLWPVDMNEAGEVLVLLGDIKGLFILDIVVLRPVVQEPDADLDGDGSVGILDLLILLTNWGPCPDPPDPCPADLDGDGTVGIFDLLILITSWS